VAQQADKIISKIMDEAKAQAGEIMEKAEKEAVDIMRKTSEESEQKTKEAVENARKEAVVRKQRMLAVAELEGRKRKLEAKQEMINKAFDKALELLTSKPDSEYEDMLADMIADSCIDGKGEIILSAADRKRVGKDFLSKVNNMLEKKSLEGSVKLSDETRDIRGGFILKKGDIEINNSFETIIRMQRDELEELVVAALF
jgi:V/A-type H+/Na+-transporting ATPase subunit E